MDPTLIKRFLSSVLRRWLSRIDLEGMRAQRRPFGPKQFISMTDWRRSGPIFLHCSWIAKSSASTEHRRVHEVGLPRRNVPMNGVIYLIGLVVVVLAVLSFLGFH